MKKAGPGAGRSPLCGACFARDGSGRILAAAYDCIELFVWANLR